MPAFNFQKQFSFMVEQKMKRRTIRIKQRCKPGDRVYLYTGMRTKACRKLGEAICTRVSAVTIHENSYALAIPGATDLFIEGRACALELFAMLDGFESWADMISWFQKNGGLPFKGFLHQWD